MYRVFNMDRQPIVSIIICTVNRASRLKKALDSLLVQRIPDAKWELLIIDNGSTDTTKHLIERVTGSTEQRSVRSVYVAAPGLSKARNVGVSIAKGKYIGFFDDDAIAPEGWLARAMRLFSTIEPTPMAVGGKILPHYDGGKPQWFEDRYETDTKGDISRFLRKGETFSSSNMIVDRHLFTHIPAFDERIGMTGTVLAVAEETAWFEQLWDHYPDLCRFYYDATLSVYHTVTEQKMRVRYRLSRSFAAGSALAVRSSAKPFSNQGRVFIRCAGIVVLLPIVALVQIALSRSVRGWVVDVGGRLAYAAGYLSRRLGLVIQFQQAKL